MASRAAWKNNTIMSAAPRNAVWPVNLQVASAPNAEGNCRHQQRYPEICKRRQSEILHVPQCELISAGMLAEGLRNVSRRGQAAGENKES